MVLDLIFFWEPYLWPRMSGQLWSVYWVYQSPSFLQYFGVSDLNLCPDIESNKILPDVNGDQAETGGPEPLKPRSRDQIVNLTHQPQHLARDWLNLYLLASCFDLLNK